MAACDIAVATQGTFFMFSEVRLGLVPAVIGPYVMKKIGESAARRYMLTAEKFNAEEAMRIGLVQYSTVLGSFDSTVRGIATQLGLAGSEALNNCKQLIQNSSDNSGEELLEYTATMIADLRASDEGQEGMASFLENRDPAWQGNSL